MTTVVSGGLTTTLAWDYNQKLTGITYPGGATNSFVTNDLGNRVSKVDSGGTTTSLYDGSSVLADSRADYTQGGVTGLISERASGTSKFYHGDQLGSTRGITSAAQATTDSREYDPFGLLIATTGTTAMPFGFVGGQGYRSDSQSGLQLLGARYYDACIGRFISRDPIGYGGGDANLYRYCANDPVNATDPSGLFIVIVPVAYYCAVWVSVLLLMAVMAAATQAQMVADMERRRQARETYYHYSEYPYSAGTGLWANASGTTSGEYWYYEARDGLGVPDPRYVYPVTIDPTITPVTPPLDTPESERYAGGLPEVRFPIGTPPGLIGMPSPVPGAP